MTGHTAKGVPYALSTDALIDYPAASLELANMLGPAPTVVTALPTTGLYDGREVLLQAGSGATAVLWHMRYSSTLAGWHCIGGPPLCGFDSAGYAPGGNWTIGPTLTLPARGTYAVHYGGAGVVNAGGNVNIPMCPTGPGWPADTNAFPNPLQVGCILGARIQASGVRTLTFTATGNVRLCASGDGRPFVLEPWMTLTPLQLFAP